MWVGTKEGLIRYQFQQGAWQVYTEENRLGNVDIRTILKDSRGTLWVGTAASGLYRSSDNGMTWQAVSIESQNTNGIIHQVYEDKQSNLWVLADSLAGSRSYRNLRGSEGWELFTHPQQPQLLDSLIYTIFEDSRGLLWFGTMDGLVQYDPVQDQWQTFTTQNGLPDNVIKAIAEDKTGDMWFGTSDGVARFSPSTDDWKTFTEENGFTDSETVDILSDQDDNMWFATFGNGIFKYNLN